MGDAVIRLGVIFFGILMLLDVLLPKATHYMQITDHSFSSATHKHGARHKLYFNNDLNRSCSVNEEAFKKLKDGDEVVVQNTRMLKRCITIERNGEVVYRFTEWIFLSLLIFVGCIVYGMGWVKFGRD